jgi:hypothetical protein
MKQKGTIWITAEGLQVPSNRVQPYEKIAEKLAQHIAAEAVKIETDLFRAKKAFLEATEEMYVRHKAKNNGQDVNSFSFYTFDKGYRIEVDRKRASIKIFKATKANPSYKDYEQVITDLSQVKTIEEAKTMESEGKSLYEKGMDQELSRPSDPGPTRSETAEMPLLVKNETPTSLESGAGDDYPVVNSSDQLVLSDNGHDLDGPGDD